MQTVILRARALYAYAATGPNEISFTAGEILDVETRGPPGNWSRTRKGAFPTDYAEFFEEMVEVQSGTGSHS